MPVAVRCAVGVEHVGVDHHDVTARGARGASATVIGPSNNHPVACSERSAVAVQFGRARR